jgi:hypothetical protein
MGGEESMRPDAQHIGDAIALVTVEIIAALSPDSDTACANLERVAGRLLDAVRILEPGPTHDVIKAAAEILVKSEV